MSSLHVVQQRYRQVHELLLQLVALAEYDGEVVNLAVSLVVRIIREFDSRRDNFFFFSGFGGGKKA